MTKPAFILIFSFLIFSLLIPETDQLKANDSIWAKYKMAQTDSARIEILLEEIGYYFENENTDSAIKNYQAAYNKALTNNFKMQEAKASMYLGNVFYGQGNYENAIRNYQKAIAIFEIFEKSANPDSVARGKRGLSSCFSNIGNVHHSQGAFQKAIEYYNKSIALADQLLYHAKDNATIRDIKNTLGYCYNNLGIVYYSTNQFEKAIGYYKKSLTICEELNDLTGKAYCLNNIGAIYYAQKRYDNAILYYQRSLEINQKTGDKIGMASTLGNIANIHYSMADSIKVNPNSKQENLNKAIIYGLQSMKVANEIKSLPAIHSAATRLHKTYKVLGNIKKALEYSELIISTQDSMFKAEKTKAITEMEAKYHAEKKQQEIEKQQILIDKKEFQIQAQQADNKRQRILRNAFITGFLLSLLIVFALVRNYFIKQNKNKVISQKNIQLEQAYEEILASSEALTKQNEQLKEKNDEITNHRNQIEIQQNMLKQQHGEITSSIQYALRIQRALFPSQNYLKSLPLDIFVFNLPKSIVSGDFYWVYQINHLLVVCVADCTGHGVPGAFMSMLGMSFLNEIIRKKEITDTGKILNELRANVISALNQKNLDIPQIDGMDVGLCVYNTQTKKLQFSGANIPCWIVPCQSCPITLDSPAKTNDRIVFHPSVQRENGSFGQIVELKPDRMPIAIYDEMNAFQFHEYLLSKGDFVYLFTDGFKDQFGAANKTKFSGKKLRNLLVEISEKSALEQKNILITAFTRWKGPLEQIDDVTVLGFQI